jgi:hypothetical protein
LGLASSFSGVTQKVNNNRRHSDKRPAGQGAEAVNPDALKISASTPYDFSGRNLTDYGGLLPVATMLEKPMPTASCCTEFDRAVRRSNARALSLPGGSEAGASIASRA